MTSAGGTIQVPAEEVYALAAGLRAQSGVAEEAWARLQVSNGVGGPLQAAVEGFLECHRTAAEALRGELLWLGDTVAAVADSWLGLDASMLAPGGEARPR